MSNPTPPVPSHWLPAAPSPRALADGLAAWWSRLRARDDDRFVLAIGLALALHLAPFVVGAGLLLSGIEIDLRSETEKRIGDPNGSPEGVNVEVIDAKEYQNKYLSFSAGKDKIDQEATIGSVERPKVEASKPKPEPQPEKAEKPQPEKQAQEQAEAEPPQKDKTETKDLETAGIPPPKPEAKQKAEPKAEPRPRQAAPAQRTLSEAEIDEIIQTARQDFQSAAQMSSKAALAAMGNASPFVRSVLRKLKATMPKSRGMRGTLVARLVIGDDGAVVWVGIPRSSGNPELDKLVAEAIRTTRFDVPGPGVPMNERKFEITYEYD